MRIRILFILIILYVIAGFSWWTYSLIRFSNSEFQLKNQLIQAEQLNCAFKVAEMARGGKFISERSDTMSMNGVIITADTLRMNAYVSREFSDRYYIRYQFERSPKTAGLMVNPATTRELRIQLNLQKRGFTIEAILLTLLIATGIFGVYYSVNMIFVLNRQQNNFLLSVTHELKTPIAAIRLIAETMKRRSLPPEKQTELLGTILENTERLQDMTENMLTAMQMENNRYVIRKEEVDLSGLVEDVRQSFALKAEIHGRTEPGISMIGDPVLLKMTLNNLLENAIKYSSGQPVDLNLGSGDGQIILEVSDQGIGIDEKYRKKVFRKFYRVQDEETRETKGSGLGLFIVKQAVEKHRGKIYVESNVPKGTVFKIVFKKHD